MENYISLKEAAKYCDYSQDYLKLRARQGKFKAVKIGRNWVTTREWVREYGQRQCREVRLSTPQDRVLPEKFKLVSLIAGAGLAAYLIFLLVDLGYFKVNINSFLANIGSLIPSKIIEIR